MPTRLPFVLGGMLVMLLAGFGLALPHSWIGTYLAEPLASGAMPRLLRAALYVGCVAAATTACLRAGGRRRTAIGLLLPATYAALMTSPVVLVMALAAFGTVWIIGEAAAGMLRRPQPLHVALAFGIFAHLVVAIALSLVHAAGGIVHAGLLIVLALACAAAGRPALKRRLASADIALPRTRAGTATLFLVLFVVLWAVGSMRTLGLCVDCAMGLYRPDLYIFGWGSMFDGPSLLWGTHYYPKGFEIVAAPFIVTDHAVEMRLFNLLLAFASLASVIAWLSRRLLERETVVLPYAAAVLSMPVLVFAASQSKADALEAIFMVAGVVHLAVAARERDIGQYALAGMLMVLALTLRNHMFVPVLTMVPALAVIGIVLAMKSPRADVGRAVALVAVSVAIFATVVFVRNGAITGLVFATPPIGPATPSAFRAAFTELTGIQTRRFGDSLLVLPSLLKDIFFDPAALGAHRDRWVGQFGPWLLVFGLSLLPFAVRSPRVLADARFIVPAWAAAACWAVLCYGLVYAINRKGADGNYFIYPLLAASIPILFVAVRIPGMMTAWAVGAAFVIAVNLAALPAAVPLDPRLMEAALMQPRFASLDSLWRNRTDAMLRQRGLDGVAALVGEDSGRTCRITVFDRIAGEQPVRADVADMIALYRTPCVVGSASGSPPDVDLVLSDRKHTAILIPRTAPLFEASIRERLDALGARSSEAGKFAVYLLPR